MQSAHFRRIAGCRDRLTSQHCTMLDSTRPTIGRFEFEIDRVLPRLFKRRCKVHHGQARGSVANVRFEKSCTCAPFCIHRSKDVNSAQHAMIVSTRNLHPISLADLSSDRVRTSVCNQIIVLENNASDNHSIRISGQCAPDHEFDGTYCNATRHQLRDCGPAPLTAKKTIQVSRPRVPARPAATLRTRRSWKTRLIETLSLHSCALFHSRCRLLTSAVGGRGAVRGV